MRFIVYGPGAIGGLVGALLFEHGEDVLLVARGEHAEAIGRSGLTVDSPEGRRVVRAPVVLEPSQAEVGPDDLVLLAMKSQGTGTALSALRRVAPPSTPVACLQNGIDNERAASRLFSEVVGVCVMCPATHLAPGVVQSFSSPVPGLLDVGLYPTGTSRGSAQLADAFRAATFDSIERSDIMRWKYRKLLMNLGNAVEAICRPPGRSEITRLALEEGEACLTAAGIEFATVDEDQTRRGELLRLREANGERRGGGSSWQSLQRGTGSIESDYLNGEIAMIGRQHGIPTPVNSLLQHTAWTMAMRRDRPGSISVPEFLALLAEAQATTDSRTTPLAP